MRILAQIVTFNDERVLPRSLAALLAQTRPVDEILIIDNGSTDRTLERVFPERVTVVRHPRNLGTSGAAVTALRHGLRHGYDWVWLLDADSAPRPDALEKLLALYESLSAERRERIRVLASLPVDVSTGLPHHGILFHPRGFRPASPRPGEEIYEADTTIWSGSLFHMGAVREIGLPCADYVLDWGENEYGWRGKQKGFVALVHQGSVLDHNIDRPGGRVGPRERVERLGPLTWRLPELPPIRLYYIYRNLTYFFLYEYYEGRLLPFLRFAASWMPRHLVKLALSGRFVPDLVTCLRGLREGLRGQLHRQYDA